MAVVIIALTVLDGFEKVVSEKIITLNAHIKITGFGNRNLPSPESLIPQLSEKYGSKIRKIEPFISKLALIKSKKFSDGITITGLHPDDLRNNIGGYLIEGSIDSLKQNEIIIGRKLAEKLRVKLNDRVTLFSVYGDEIPSPASPPAIDMFKIVAIFESGMSEYDDLNAYILFDKASDFFGMFGRISGYNLQLKNINDIEPLTEQLQDFLGYPYYVRSVFEIYQNIFTWLDLQKEPIPIVLGLIIFVAVFNIVGTLLMIVLEKTRSIGILRTLGATRKKITTIFLLHGFYLTTIGIILGDLLAYILTLIQMKFDIIKLPENVYFVTHVPLYIDINNYLLISLVTAFISLITSFIPAYISSKIEIISAIKFD
ncbi:ABC transporter permease [Melioribacter sp. OK-6-Me]|uniref:ABC transporter permease n=1 Tax=Melioribacter sp. OK-6-Me TaxID=3423433 RepID=UPI003EDAE349